MPLSRRRLVGASGVALLTYTVGGCERRVTPAAARRESFPLTIFDPAEAAELGALAEALVPGSEAQGVVHFIDHQLSTAPPEQMLMLRYLGVPAPFDSFYKGGIAAATSLALREFGSDIAALDTESASRLAGRIASGEDDDWAGPPAGFFYFVLRNDACDVVYGTEGGFERLGVPYMAHIRPPSRWGA